MMNDDKYTPISCATYSEYELAIMHRQKLRLAWQDELRNSHIRAVTPNDLRTHKHAEYLLATDSCGEELCLRLDRIIEAQAL